MNGIRDLMFKLGGRRFLLALGGAAAVGISSYYGVEEAYVLGIVGVLASFILGESWIDSAKKKAEAATPNEFKADTPEGATIPYPGTKVLPILLLAFGAMMFLNGCGSSEQAIRSNIAMEQSAINYSENMNRVVDGLIEDYRVRAYAEADKLAEEAIAAEVKIVDGAPVANPNNLLLIMGKKAEHYAAIELRVLEMKKKIIAAHKDLDHLRQYSKALDAYFKQQATTAELVEHSTDQVLEFLDRFVGKSKK